MKNEKQGNSKNSVLEEIASLFEKNEQDIQSKRNPDKTYWNADMVNNYLDKHSGKIILPEDVYCTENFTWNEILMTLNKDISRPSMEILQNLYYLANIVQIYRNVLDLPITITSAWRSKEEQDKLIAKNDNKASTTSLHLEDLAFDVSVPNMTIKEFQSKIDDTLLGEVEKGDNYTHIALPTFSEDYLKRHNLDKEKYFRKLLINPKDMTPYERNLLIKRLNPKNWERLSSSYNAKDNEGFFKNYVDGEGRFKPIDRTEAQNNDNLFDKLSEEFKNILSGLISDLIPHIIKSFDFKNWTGNSKEGKEADPAMPITDSNSSEKIASPPEIKKNSPEISALKNNDNSNNVSSDIGEYSSSENDFEDSFEDGVFKLYISNTDLDDLSEISFMEAGMQSADVQKPIEDIQDLSEEGRENLLDYNLPDENSQNFELSKNETYEKECICKDMYQTQSDIERVLMSVLDDFILRQGYDFHNN